MKRWVLFVLVLWTMSGVPGIAQTCAGYSYYTDTFGNKHYYLSTDPNETDLGSTCPASSGGGGSVTPVSNTNGSSYLTMQIDNPNLMADGVATTTVRVQTWYKNSNGVSYPATGAFVSIHGTYGGTFSAFTDSGGNANFTWHTLDSGIYGITAHWGSLFTSVSVSPQEPPATSWVNNALPGGSPLYHCGTSMLSGLPDFVPFAWQWYCNRLGESNVNTGRFELLHAVNAYDPPGVYPYNKTILTAHYSDSRNGSFSTSAECCQYGQSDWDYVLLYFNHVVGDYDQFSDVLQSGGLVFYVAP